MSPVADRAPSAPPPGNARGLVTLLRHQLGALFTTAVDFGTMIVCVSAFGLSAVAGTAVGAAVGAITNFTLARRWIFMERAGGSAPRVSPRLVRSQAWRYLAVSAASLGWNTLGEHLTHDLAHLPYVLARAMVAAVVSLGWNYPLQKKWVFRADPASRASLD